MNYEDELTGIVEDFVTDIIQNILGDGYDEINAKLKAIKTGTDDGTAYGDYEIIVADGKFVIALSATAIYGGFEDCFSWSNESHYTRDVTYEELQDFDYEIKSIKRFDEALDKMIEVDIEAARESR